MKTISEYKNMALSSLEGKWTKAAVASLIAENPLLADFKAVQENQVWQVRRSLYQSSDKASRLVLDFAEMMDGGSDTNMLFLEKVGE